MGQYVTPAGLQIPTVQELLDKTAAEQREEIDALLDTDPDSPVGQLNGIVMSAIREGWEVTQMAFNGLDPNQAEGPLLDGVSAITGTTRAKDTPSRFIGKRKLTVDLDANTTIPKGSVVHVSGAPLIRFVTTEPVSSVLAGLYKVAAECEKTGPTTCNAGTLIVIATPVVGWNSVTNTFDAELGHNIDLDPAFRVRREDELRATGSTNPDSLRSDLLALEIDGDKPVLDVHVLFNDTDSPSAEGLPPHSMEALIFDGLSAAVPNDSLAQVIWDGKPGGVQMIGTTSGVALDSTGKKHTIRFSRPAIKDIAFKFTIEVNLDAYAGDVAAKLAVVTRFQEKVHQGAVIRCNDYLGALMAVSGVIDVPSGIQITFNGNPFPVAGINLALGLRQMGNTQSSWITLTTV